MTDLKINDIFVHNHLEHDFTVAFEDYEIKLHKKVLAKNSQYFSSLFSFDKNATIEKFDKDHLLTKEMFLFFANHWYSTNFTEPTLPLECRKDFTEQVRDVANYLLVSVTDIPLVRLHVTYAPEVGIKISNPPRGWLVAIFPDNNDEKYYIPELEKIPHNMTGGIKKSVNNFIRVLNEHFNRISIPGEVVMSFNLEQRTHNNHGFGDVYEVNQHKYFTHCSCYARCTCLTPILKQVVENHFRYYSLFK